MEENNQPKKTPRRRLGPFLWPLLLIAIGLLLLLDTLGLLGQSAWDILWNLWPLLFIALGLDALFRKKEIFGRSIWLSLLVMAVVLGILAVALGLTGVNLPAQSTIETTVKEPLGTAEQADVSIAMGVGELNLYSLKDSNALIAGEISTDGAHVRSQSTMRGDTIVFSLEHSNPVMVPFDNAWQWDLGLTTEIPLELESSMGVGSMGLTLDEIMLEELSIGQGVGEIEVILPDGDYRAEIGQAVGQLVVEIPEGVPVRLEISRAVSGLSLPDDFEKHNDYYYTPGARGADEYIKIEINQAVGSIIVRYVR